MRLIDADNLIEVFERNMPTSNAEMLKQYVDKQPTVRIDEQWAAKNIMKWIPCDERPIPIFEDVLITNIAGVVERAMNEGDECLQVGIPNDIYREEELEYAIAWMPLPEPYTEQ